MTSNTNTATVFKSVKFSTIFGDLTLIVGLDGTITIPDHKYVATRGYAPGSDYPDDKLVIHRLVPGGVPNDSYSVASIVAYAFHEEPESIWRDSRYAPAIRKFRYLPGNRFTIRVSGEDYIVDATAASAEPVKKLTPGDAVEKLFKETDDGAPTIYGDVAIFDALVFEILSRHGLDFGKHDEVTKYFFKFLYSELAEKEIREFFKE